MRGVTDDDRIHEASGQRFERCKNGEDFPRAVAHAFSHNTLVSILSRQLAQAAD